MMMNTYQIMPMPKGWWLMLCSVKLKTYNDYTPIDHTKFEPHSKFLFGDNYRPRRLIERAVQNPRNKDIFYLPNLTLSRRRDFIYPVLYSDLCLPKLIYGNNILEVTDADRNPITEELVKRLLIMGIEINSDAIQNSRLDRCDFAKNIFISKKISIPSILEELSKADTRNLRLEIETRDYSNDGKKITIGCGSYQIIIYDKTKESKTQNINIDCNVLRIEIRFLKETTLRNKLLDIGFSFKDNYRGYPMFKDIFSEEISQKIINHYWNILAENLPKSYSTDEITEEVYSIENNKFSNLNMRKEFMFFGMSIFEKTVGFQRLKDHMKSKISNSSYYDFIKEYRNYKSISKINTSTAVQEITEQLNEFIMITPNVLNELIRDKNEFENDEIIKTINSPLF